VAHAEPAGDPIDRRPGGAATSTGSDSAAGALPNTAGVAVAEATDEGIVEAAAAPATGTAGLAVEPEADEARRARRNHRRWRAAWAVLAVVIVVGGGAVAYLVWQAQRTPTHAVPSVEGLHVKAAEQRLEALGFDVATRHVRRDGTTAGRVLAVDPATGERVAEGDRVTLTVSDGQTLVTIPGALAGASEADANSKLSGLGLVVGTPSSRFSEDVGAGHVISTDPAIGTKIEKGAPVSLVVSKGPKPRIVPDVSGLSPDQAEAALRDVGLVPKVTTRLDTHVDKGGLIGLDPGPGTSAPRGSTVTVVVSAGLLVAVPTLDGVSTVAEAIARLQDAGLVADNLSGSGSLSGTPVAFDPPAGTMVAKGSPVNIVVR
jgi:serine/threonine-protein kinase